MVCIENNMCNKIKTKSIANILSICSLLIYIFSVLFMKLEYVTASEVFFNGMRVIRYISVGLLVISILINIFAVNEFNKKQLIAICFILAYVIIVNYIFNSYPLYLIHNQMLVYCLLEIALKNIDYRKIIKIIFCFLFSYLMVIILLTMLSVLRFSVPKWGVSNNRVRLSVGIHPNSFSYIFLFIVFAYIYIRNVKLEKYEFVLLIIVTIIQYYIYTSRSVFFLAILFIITSYLVINFEFIRKIYFKNKTVFLALPIILATLSLVLIFNYDSSILWMKQLDHILSGRLTLANQHLSDTGLTLFGSNFNKLLYMSESGFDDFDNASYIDMSFVACYIRFGLITLLLYVGSLSYFAYVICKKRDILMLNVFLFMMVFTFFNDAFYLLEENFFLLIWSYVNSHIRYCYNSNYEAIY